MWVCDNGHVTMGLLHVWCSLMKLMIINMTNIGRMLCVPRKAKPDRIDTKGKCEKESTIDYVLHTCVCHK